MSLLIAMALSIPNSLVLGGAFACMALLLLGGIVRQEISAGLGGALRLAGNVGLVVSLGLTGLQVASRFSPDGFGGPATPTHDEAQVQGRETRIPMAEDGHFWVKARVNGVDQRFLVDTGATFTTLAQDVATRAGVAPGDDVSADPAVTLHTAHGDALAQMARIASLKVGGIEAHGSRAVIAPDEGITNVLGMNFLSGLASWRVEDRVLVLVPKDA